MEDLLPAELALDEEPFNDDELTSALASRCVDHWPTTIEGEPAPDRFEPIERWYVDGQDTAEWAMRKLAAIDAEQKALAAQRDAYVERITAWFDRRAAVLAPRRQFFEGHLCDYQDRRRAADPKAKTLVLPSGEVRSRAVPAKVKVENDALFVKWALGNAPEVLETVHKVVARNLKERFAVADYSTVPSGDRGQAVVDASSGEVVPGLIVEPADVRFTAVPS